MKPRRACAALAPNRSRHRLDAVPAKCARRHPPQARIAAGREAHRLRPRPCPDGRFAPKRGTATAFPVIKHYQGVIIHGGNRHLPRWRGGQPPALPAAGLTTPLHRQRDVQAMFRRDCNRIVALPAQSDDNREMTVANPASAVYPDTPVSARKHSGGDCRQFGNNVPDGKLGFHPGARHHPACSGGGKRPTIKETG